MANPTVAEISASRGKATGAVSWADLGTALPTTAIATLTGFTGLGYIGADGIQPSREISTDDVKDMNGDTVFVLQTDFTRGYEFELLQSTNVDVNELIFGSANVTVTAGGPTNGALVTSVDKGEQQAHFALVVDTFNVDKKHRETAADVQVESVEFGPLVGTAVRSYKVKLKVFRDGSGNFVTSYDDDGVLVP